ncbi:hypothetical protein GF396_03980 [Candidatus Pacearchaeota archaeon]|nr:hypothetical protein [Candidatus Pacearchaeota archaeon]
MEKLLYIGIVFIVIGIIFTAISSINLSLNKTQKSKCHIAIGGFIGPIPFGFFTSKKAFLIWIMLLIVGIILFLASRRFIN